MVLSIYHVSLPGWYTLANSRRCRPVAAKFFLSERGRERGTASRRTCSEFRHRVTWLHGHTQWCKVSITPCCTCEKLAQVTLHVYIPRLNTGESREISSKRFFTSNRHMPIAAGVSRRGCVNSRLEE